MAQLKLEDVRDEGKNNYQLSIYERFKEWRASLVLNGEKVNLKKIAHSLKMSTTVFYRLPNFGLSFETLNKIDKFLTENGY